MSERVTTGVPGFDTLLSGGLVRGGLCVLGGNPGTGKTVLANQIAFHHVASGGRALVVTVLAETVSRLLGHLSGFSFFDPTPVGERLRYVSAHSVLQEGAGAVLDLIRGELVKDRPTLLVVDGLETICASCPDERGVRSFMHSLEVATEHLACTAVLLTSSNLLLQSAGAGVDGLIELTQEALGTRIVRAIVVQKFRGTSALGGRHLFDVGQDGVTMYPRFESQFRLPSGPIGQDSSLLTFNSPALDAMLGGGLSAGSSSLLLGASGTGKTLLAIRFLTAGAEHNEPGLYFGTYEAPARLIAKAQGVGLGLAKHAETTAVELQWEPAIDIILDRTGGRILEAVRRRGVRRLAIDGLNALQIAGAHPERLTVFLTALCNELRALEVTTVLTADTTPLFATHFDVPTQGVQQVADNLILLRYVESRSQLHRLISVLKVDDRAYDSSIREFRITAAGFDVASTFESAEAILTGVAHATGRSSDAEAR